MELSMEHVSKQFKDLTAVDDISLHITPGVWGLLGANGAGKTTLMRMIAGIMTPSSGHILYDGVPITELKESYRDVFGYLPQEFGFYPEFTVKDYLEYVSVLKGLTEKDGRRKINELLEQLTLSHVKNKKIIKLSGGTKRRVGIAQALLNDPEVLILDEPTSGLDPGERVRFRNLLSEFAHDRIVLISTHIVSDVEYIAKEILLLRKGTLVMQGTPRELEQSIQGKVWEVSANEADMALMVDTYCVSNIKQQDGSYLLRIVDDGKPLRGAKPVSPNLDEVFLHTFFQPSEGQI